MADVTVAAPASRWGIGPGLFAGLACLGDILLLRGWLLGHLAMVNVILLHSCFALLLGMLALLTRQQLFQPVVATVVLLLLFGPLGGPALMITGVPAHASRSRTPIAAGKQGRRAISTSRTEALFNQIRQGRRHPLPPQPVRSFLDTFETGTIEEQQQAIAAISRSYHPDMRPALSAALASPIPAIRVQASAVYAKHRGTFEARAKELIALDKAGARPSDRNLVEECLTVSRSGFVDAGTQQLLQEIADRFADPVIPSSPSVEDEPSDRAHRFALEPAPRLRRHACGGLE